MYPKAWCSYCSEQEGNGADGIFHPSAAWRGSPSMAHGVLEADLPLRTWLGHDPGEDIAMYCQSQIPEGKKSMSLNSHPNLLNTAGHCQPEEWETSRLWPRQVRAPDSTGILFHTGIYIPQNMPLLCKVMLCYLSWARVSLYVTMAVTASDTDPRILGPKPAQPDLCFQFQH